MALPLLAFVTNFKFTNKSYSIIAWYKQFQNLILQITLQPDIVNVWSLKLDGNHT